MIFSCTVDRYQMICDKIKLHALVHHVPDLDLHLLRKKPLQHHENYIRHHGFITLCTLTNKSMFGKKALSSGRNLSTAFSFNEHDNYQDQGNANNKMSHEEEFVLCVSLSLSFYD